MARGVSRDQVTFFRALIEELQDGEWTERAAYGPYASKSHARDRRAEFNRARYEAGTRRKRVQKQVAVDGKIVWRDV